MERKITFETTSFSLHILAMACMLLDHLWGTVVPGNDWMTCVGRMAFPIFAFMIVEGYFHTGNLRRYVLRLLFFALLSEIPFNLVIGGGVFYPFHQNVLWTFLIAIAAIACNERAARTGKLWIRILVGVLSTALGALAGLFTLVDYYHVGVLTVLVFYFLRGNAWWQRAAQLICLWYLNVEMLGGRFYELELMGETVEIVQQGFALLALLPIWLYRGAQGYYSKTVKKIYYLFYPLHLLVLGILMQVL